MKSLAYLSLTLVTLMGCAQVPKNEVKADNDSFGPFFLPADNRLDSISLNYFTRREEVTSVYFSMVGEVDWERREESLSCYHNMVFKNLEESAVYQFRINSKHKAFSKKSYVKTVPYGRNYRFDFGLARLGYSLEIKRSPHFLILLADDQRVNENIFLPYYERNRDILASTILVPLFDLEIRNKLFSLSEDGFYLLRYKNTDIILLYKDFKDTARISYILTGSVSPGDCFIVAAVSDPSILHRVAADYNSRVRAVYTVRRNGVSFPRVQSIENYMLVTIENKGNFAVK